MTVTVPTERFLLMTMCNAWTVATPPPVGTSGFTFATMFAPFTVNGT